MFEIILGSVFIVVFWIKFIGKVFFDGKEKNKVEKFEFLRYIFLMVILVFVVLVSIFLI